MQLKEEDLDPKAEIPMTSRPGPRDKVNHAKTQGGKGNHAKTQKTHKGRPRAIITKSWVNQPKKPAWNVMNMTLSSKVQHKEL